MSRASGILMHITSLPGEFGIGTFGAEAYKFVDFLKECNQTYWQILPLTTTSYGDSPYQSFSAIAGNTNLIDFVLLEKQGLLSKKDFMGINFGSNEEKVDYSLLFKERRPILEKAVKNFLDRQENRDKLNKFVENNEIWLKDYAEFMAIKEHFNYQSLVYWDKDIRNAEKSSREKYRILLKNKIEYYLVTQYFFFEQWLKLKDYANKQGVKIIGDMPIYVAADSVEMWLSPELFKVDSKNNLQYVSGCPADSFSPDGQLWGNPVYNWQNHADDNFNWWVYRIEENLKLYDKLRIDHFKGFSDYWQIKADAIVAKIGTWEPGPGIELFNKVKEKLGNVDIIAEDLGFIDDKAKKLLKDSGFPGMKILQFGLDEKENSLDLPHNYINNSISYTGTHDNDVINGWYAKKDKEDKRYIDKYINRKENELITEAMIRTIMASTSDIAIIMMQDLLDKDESCRMNTPSTVGGNWEWRMKKNDITKQKREYLKELTEIYGRKNN